MLSCTFEEYLAYEWNGETKHEFDNGDVLSSTDCTSRHSALAVKVTTALENTRRPGCTIFQSDMRVRVLATGRATYPDVSMVCGPIEYDPADPGRTTITNPTLLVEVSVTTERGDRGNKWLHYQRIPSLQEYLLVTQEEPRVEIFRRMSSGSWEYLDVREGVLKLASGATLDLATLYDDLPV